MEEAMQSMHRMHGPRHPVPQPILCPEPIEGVGSVCSDKPSAASMQGVVEGGDVEDDLVNVGGHVVLMSSEALIDRLAVHGVV